MPEASVPTSGPTHPSAGRRRIVLLLGVLGLLYAAGLNGHWRFQRDSARYMALARSLAEDGTYRFNGRPHTLVWPGFPAMLAPVYMAAGQSFLAMNALLSLLGLGAVAAAWALYRELPLNARQAAVCTLLFGFSRTLYYYSSHIMSDVPFTVFALITLLCGTIMLRSPGRTAWLWCAAASVTAAAACFIRPVGPVLPIALVSAVWLTPGVRRGRLAAGRTLMILVPVLAAGFAWNVRTAMVREPNSFTYFDVFIERHTLRETVLGMAVRAPRIVDALPDAVLGLDVGWSLGLLMAVAMAMGLATALRRGERLACTYGVVYLATICLAAPGRRFLLPALPVLIYWLVLGMHSAAAVVQHHRPALSPRRAAVVGHVLLALAVGTNLTRISKLVYEARAPGFYERIEDGRLPDYFALTAWLRDNATARDVVFAREHETVHYFSRVRTRRAGPGWERDPLGFLGRTDVTLVVRDPDKDAGWEHLPHLMRARPDVFEPVARFGRLEVLRLHREALPRAPDAAAPAPPSSGGTTTSSGRTGDESPEMPPAS
ncbi:MAG: phospholipid carrier-dependent glycosyltransferase [Candidatus Brocadiaceae bacterium]|nr:phospholipid carrier-dependent glycosyltransferase [Candidatus Brocadiaceae bacterium]